ncbi:MAG: aminotransferase class I/II-fold pyridoxal phosphate-dependent enzyme [Roseburia sp.]
MEYLDQKLESYSHSGTYPFHMPGHKRRALSFPNPYEIDITEIDGFDNLHQAGEILKEAQERAAGLYGAKQSFYLVNGSTCGLLAAICAATGKGDKVLLARNCHKAVYHALYLRELKAEYLYPEIMDCGILGKIPPEEVRTALAAQPDIRAVILTSPTYEGVVSDVEAIAEAAHTAGIPLIVDAAHGAHLGFGAGFPESAVRQGADAVIMSLHKTLPSFTQTALLHLCSDRINPAEVSRFLAVFETSSPSYLFMAGMDACIRMLQEDGGRLFADYRKRLDGFYESVKDLTMLRVLGADRQEDGASWDDSKLVIFTDRAGITGEELHRRLLGDYRLQMEMVSGDYVLGMTSIMDTDEGFGRLSVALHEIDSDLCKTAVRKDDIICTENSFIHRVYQKNPKKLSIAGASELPWEEVRAEQAKGRVAADYICLYPPGIPLIVPGEVITQEFVERLFLCAEKKLQLAGGGIRIDGADDPDKDCIFLKTILY